MPSSYGVVEQVYLEPEGAASLDWQDRAACAGNDTDVFFPWGGNTPAALVSLCESCPVTETCREYAIDRDWITGVWGGTTRAQRDEIRRRRAAGLPDEPEDEPRCRNNHVLDEANTYRRSDGRGIRCRQCVRDYWHLRQARKREDS
jgi:WhiB family redox-sensing transcriptional regulator